MSLSPNKIKYTTVNTKNTIKVKNFVLGINTTPGTPYGPTSSTGFWNCITPPPGGYTIYINKATQGPSIYVPVDDTELNRIALMFGSSGNPLLWFSTQNDMICTNIDYPDIVTGNLIRLYDAGFTCSYPKGDTNIYDLSFNNTTGTINGPINYDSLNGGILTFDSNIGNPYIDIGLVGEDLSRGLTICGWLNFGTPQDNERIVELYNSSGNNIIFSRKSTTDDLSFEVLSGGTSLGNVTFSNGIDGSQFNFYAVKLDPDMNTVKLFAKTSSITSNINLRPANVSRNNCFIGKSSNPSDKYFDGQIGVIMIYDRSLSDDEIIQNYNAYSSRYTP